MTHHLATLALLGVLAAGRSEAQQSPSPQPPATTLAGAVRHGELRAEPVSLSLDEALARGLQYNVGLFVAGTLSDEARAARLQQLSELLPRVDASLRESRQKTNLAALGISFPGVPQTVEVPNFDARVSISAPLIDLHARSNVRAAEHSVAAAVSDSRFARESVVLAIASSYLQTVSAEAALASAEADRTTAQALYELARDRERSGLSPNIDTLRAQVEWQGREQAVTQARNTLDKQRVALLRIVGLPLRQSLVLTSRMPYQAMSVLEPADALARATATREDYKSAEEQVQAAESTKRAAVLQRAPTATFNGDYGALGTEPSNALATWSATGLVRVPIFEGGRIRAEVARADAALAQRKAERDDLRISIEQDVTNALLDVASAGQQVDLAAATAGLARQALTQAQDRFAAGVTNNIEVIQAQEALVNSNNQYIGALQAHNLAKLMLAHAMGSAEHMWKQILAE